MKITCHCGALIVDQSDGLPHKAHVIPDESWDGLLEAIDNAIEGPAARPAAHLDAKESACMELRQLLAHTARLAWQCSACGRLYIDDHAGRPVAFTPQSIDAASNLFRKYRPPHNHPSNHEPNSHKARPLGEP